MTAAQLPTLKHMGKFSISLYMFFSFCIATAASSSLVKDTETDGGLMKSKRFTLSHFWMILRLHEVDEKQFSGYCVTVAGLPDTRRTLDCSSLSAIYGQVPNFPRSLPFSPLTPPTWAQKLLPPHPQHYSSWSPQWWNELPPSVRRQNYCPSFSRD